VALNRVDLAFRCAAQPGPVRSKPHYGLYGRDVWSLLCGFCAARTQGKTQTDAIEEALERLLSEHDVDPDEERIQRRIEVLKTIAAEYRALSVTGGGPRQIEELYDEATGLPL
jgi:antitoxin VapB